MRDNLPEHRNYGKNSFKNLSLRQSLGRRRASQFIKVLKCAARIQEKTKRGSTLTVDERGRFS